MSEAIKGLGDRVRVSVSGVAGSGVSTNGDYQDYIGTSGRVAVDLVDGNLILAPHVGLGYARVRAKRSEEFTRRLEGEPKGWGAPEGDTFYYTAVTERTEADRITPRVGLGLGWMLQNSEGGLGVQAVFDLGYDSFDDYQIERYPNERIRIDSKDAGGLSLRAGAEFLLEPYWWGENNPGIGIVAGIYWTRSVNPTSNVGQDGPEINLGFLFSF